MFSKHNTEHEFHLRSFQICSHMWVKGVYTSDIDYNVQTFPKDVSLKTKSNEEWHKEYEWITLSTNGEVV